MMENKLKLRSRKMLPDYGAATISVDNFVENTLQNTLQAACVLGSDSLMTN